MQLCWPQYSFEQFQFSGVDHCFGFFVSNVFCLILFCFDVFFFSFTVMLFQVLCEQFVLSHFVLMYIFFLYSEVRSNFVLTSFSFPALTTVRISL